MDKNVSSVVYDSMIKNFSAPELQIPAPRSDQSHLNLISKSISSIKRMITNLDPLNDEPLLWFNNYEKCLISIGKLEYAKEILLDFLDAKYGLVFYYKAKRYFNFFLHYAIMNLNNHLFFYLFMKF